MYLVSPKRIWPSWSRDLLTDEQLIVEVRRLAEANQRLPTLLLLHHLDQPARTTAIVQKGTDIGFRKIHDWNVTDILRKEADKNEVAQLHDGWRLLDPGLDAIKATGIELGRKKHVSPTDSVLPHDLFAGTRPYIEKVVDQINGSYDHAHYDCCAVMCRRLAETLIIEVYEKQNRSQDIKGPDGNFLMLNNLIGALKKDEQMNLGRNSKKGLEELKELGDKAAHNRRFNARESDINSIKSGLRTAAEELLHLSGLAR